MNRKHFRRIFSAVLSLIMVFTLMVPFANAASVVSPYYSDVKSTSSYYTAVNYLYEHGVMRQPFTAAAARKATIQVNKFAPNQAITRLQLVHALWKMYGSPNVVESTIRMRDVYTNTDHLTAMRWAVGTGILDSVTSGSYAPDEALSIEEVMLMLYRFVDYCGYDVSYSSAAVLPRLNNEEINHALNWAISKGFINKLTAKGDYTADCSRGNVATYLYKIYNIYQKKYGLTVVNNDNLIAASRAGKGMANMFRAAGAETISFEDIYFDKASPNGLSFVDAMAAAFSEAKALDICYLYCFSHGLPSGMFLFPNGNLSPATLRAEVDKYNGMFVVFIEACFSGTFIKKSVNGTDITDDMFDAESFVSEFLATGQRKRSADNMVDESGRIKIICSSTQHEYSWYQKSTRKGYASDAWLTSCSMDGYADTYYFSGKELAADVNGDCKLSMAELFDYAYEMVASIEFYDDDDDEYYRQHMVCNPENDDTIIFEIQDWEFLN